MRITLVGMGMGGHGGLTRDAHAALAKADVILGAERLVEALRRSGEYGAAMIVEALPEAVAARIDDNKEWADVCVALSGDVGFYSAATRLRDLLRDHEVTAICGISAPQYFAARLGRPWQDFRLVSAHGRDCDVLAEALNHRAVFFLTGTTMTAQAVLNELCQAGLGDARATVGENLSSPDEAIVAGTANELVGRTYAPLSVVLVENDRTFVRDSRSAGIEDEAFARGKAPMTKREVRAVALSLLAPGERSVLWDVGAGTGSVAVEMALAARRGRVFAVERDSDACDLLRRNRLAFGVYNMTPVPGSAPDALAPLPPPDAAFVGGSGGSLPAIVAAILGKNPSARIVISAVTLETLSLAVDVFRREGIAAPDVRQIAATRTVRRGSHTMFDAVNPVFLISGGGNG